MTVSTEIILAFISAFFSVLLTAIIGIIAWSGGGLISDIETNTAFRRYMTGEGSIERNRGELTEIEADFTDVYESRAKQYEEIQSRLDNIEDNIFKLAENTEVDIDDESE